LFLFGLAADQMTGSRSRYNSLLHYDTAALDLIFSEHFTRNEPDVFERPRGTLVTDRDNDMHLADLKSNARAPR